MRKFLEAITKEGDKAFIEKLNKAETPEAVIALAKEKGFALTEADVKPESRSGELSDDELEAVAGGKACYCAVGGGGEADRGDKVCACVLYGYGRVTGFNGPLKDCSMIGDPFVRCLCTLGGYGEEGF